jgi:predicted nucleic acid-binding protein
MAILIDTSALLAYIWSKDKNHHAASQAMKQLVNDDLIVTSAVLSELFYMTAIRLDYLRAVRVFGEIKAAFQIEQLTELDLFYMEAAMLKYRDAELDYTDTSIMVVAERLNITRIFTFDRRDFGMYRPKHCSYFELIP